MPAPIKARSKTAATRGSRDFEDLSFPPQAAQVRCSSVMTPRVRQAGFCGDGDLTRELGEHLRLLAILGTFAVHDVLELGMPCHETHAVVLRKTGGERPFRIARASPSFADKP